LARGPRSPVPVWWRWFCWWMPPVAASQPGDRPRHGHHRGRRLVPIEFTARPDLSVAEKDEPTFQYSIFADVTDTTGETRSAQQVVQVGYTACGPTLTADDVADGASRSRSDQHHHAGRRRPAGRRFAEDPSRPATGTVQRPRCQAGSAFPRRMAAKGRTERRRSIRRIPTRGRWAKWWPNAASPPTRRKRLATRSSCRPGLYRAGCRDPGPVRQAGDRRAAAAGARSAADRLAIKIPNLVEAPKVVGRTGRRIHRRCGARGYDAARAFVEIEHRGKIVQSYWTDPSGRRSRSSNRSPRRCAADSRCASRWSARTGPTGIAAHRRALDQPGIARPLGAFRLEARPGQKETWTAVISGPDAEEGGRRDGRDAVRRLAGRLPAAQLAERLRRVPQDSSLVTSVFENSLRTSRFDPRRIGRWIRRTRRSAAPDLSQVSGAQNLNETAFFFPHLSPTKDGQVKLEFTMPEALTEWKFLGFAHDAAAAQRLPAGQRRDGQGPDGPAESAAVPARRRRAGVHRQGQQPVADAPDRQRAADAGRRPHRQAADAALGNTQTDQPFDIPPRSRAASRGG
jgi:hypothetical protein